MIARRVFIALLTLSAVAACAPTPSAVTGTVSYRERLVVPADSVVVVRLEDVTRGTGYPTVVSEQRIVPVSNQPVRFSLPYSPADIDPHGTYVVNAWIEEGGRILFRNASLNQVLTKTAPRSNVHVELEQVVATMPAPPGTTTTTVVPSSGGTVIVQPNTGTTIAPAPATTTTTTSPPASVVIPPAR
ncbi:MAG TPA: YbaY family lipoprotein [Ferrovibrio sp.]|jgi:putative lipoprotein|uniref:YbaY family lipoprotein n=1 Tax=Ferrovibrio sp. TaxID=1917215 RepID=UPI002ED28F44